MSERKKKKPEKKGISKKLRNSVSSLVLPTEDVSGMIKDLEDGLSYCRHCKKICIFLAKLDEKHCKNSIEWDE